MFSGKNCVERTLSDQFASATLHMLIPPQGCCTSHTTQSSAHMAAAGETLPQTVRRQLLTDASAGRAALECFGSIPTARPARRWTQSFTRSQCTGRRQ